MTKFGISEFSTKPNFYNLEAIIAVDISVDSRKATRFCQWATGILRGFNIKWFGWCELVILNKEMR